MVTENGLMQQIPLSFSEKDVKKENATGVQLLVHRGKNSVEEVAWEDYDEFIAKFSDFKFKNRP